MAQGIVELTGHAQPFLAGLPARLLLLDPAGRGRPLPPDAHRLAGIESGSIDLYAISLGLKICNRDLVLAEAWRVLRPGGMFICLEASRIPVDMVYATYLAYMELCMPLIGWAATGGDASAYGYLLKGVRDFPGAAELAREIAAHGFVDVSYERMSLGIVAIHVASKPAPGPA